MNESKKLILEWLATGKTHDQIADKFIETMDRVWGQTVEHYNLEMRNELFKALARPPLIPEMKWHGLW